jgi:hypothetical protein
MLVSSGVRARLHAPIDHRALFARYDAAADLLGDQFLGHTDASSSNPVIIGMRFSSLLVSPQKDGSTVCSPLPAERPLLPHTVARRQPASIIGSVAPGVACTKSQSDPAKMAPDTGRNAQIAVS